MISASCEIRFRLTLNSQISRAGAVESLSFRLHGRLADLFFGADRQQKSWFLHGAGPFFVFELSCALKTASAPYGRVFRAAEWRTLSYF